MLDQRALKYYRSLRIPAKISKVSGYVYVFTILALTALYLFHWYVAKRIPFTTVSTITALHLLAYLTMPLLLKILIQYMKFRQCVNMAIFLLIPGIPLEVIGSYIRLPGLNYIVVPLLGVISVRVFTNVRLKSFAIVMYTLIFELLFATYVDGLKINAVLIRSILTLIPTIIALYFTERLTYRNSIDIYKVASSWIKAMLINSDEDFSSLMDSMGMEAQIDAHVMLFDLKFKKIALIVPEIHFGPFRTVGSAAFLHIIDKLFSPTNIIPIVLHSAGSHERNLVSATESLRYGNTILSEILAKEHLVEDSMCEPFRVHSDQLESFVIQTSKTVFIAISAPTVGNDDIPYYVQVKAKDIGKMYGFDDVAIIDSHNVAGTSIADLGRYMDVIVAAVSRNSRPCTELGVGYGESVVKGHVDGLCDNKIKVLAINCDSSLHGLIYIYSNNAKIGVREALRRIAVDLGYGDAEVVTADDHSCSGISYDSPYHVVKPNVNLFKAVESALVMAKNNISRCKVYTTTVTTRSKIVGPKIFELLELAKDVSQKVLRYILTSLLTTYVLTLASMAYAFLSL